MIPLAVPTLPLLRQRAASQCVRGWRLRTGSGSGSGSGSGWESCQLGRPCTQASQLRRSHADPTRHAFSTATPSSSSATLTSPPPPPPPPSSASPAFSDRVKEVVELLRTVQHPTKSTDIISAHHVKDVSETAGMVTIKLPLDDAYRSLRTTINQLLRQRLTWVTGVKVGLETTHTTTAPSGTSQTHQHPQPARKSATAHPTHSTVNGLQHVKNIVAVSSCKGGVGKSTVSVNLAYALSHQVNPATKQRYKVGIYDADVYGPSLPTLVHSGNATDTVLRENPDNNLIIPPTYEGVKLMSYGYVRQQQVQAQLEADIASGKIKSAEDMHAQASGSILMRGPMVSNMVQQLLRDTDWQELDYLIIDMPPGTGDIAITLTQQLQLTAAVVITTPQVLAYIDVIKGIDMFKKVNVPVISVVENMSYFECTNCTTKHEIFGKGHLTALQQQFGIEHGHKLPLQPSIAQRSDLGRPFVLDTSNEATAPVRQIYSDIADSVVKGVISVKQNQTPHIAYDPTINQILVRTPSDNHIYNVTPYDLRLACQCAGCVDEHTGVSKLNSMSEEERHRRFSSVKPVGMQPRGNYAMAVHWSDGHASSIYPYKQILAVAKPFAGQQTAFKTPASSQPTQAQQAA